VVSLSRRSADVIQYGTAEIALPTLNYVHAMALYGSLAPLENYGDQVVNGLIHQRNQDVLALMSQIYNGYIEGKGGYVEKAMATKSEKALRALGRPITPYVMPMPGNSENFRMDLYGAMNFNQLAAWRAIAVHLDKLSNRLTEGAPFISVSAKYEVPVPIGTLAPLGLERGDPHVSEMMATSVEIEGKFTVQFTGEETIWLPEHEEKTKIAKEGKFKIPWSKGQKIGGEGGIEFKRSVKDPEDWEVTIKAGPGDLEFASMGELEFDKKGRAKISIQALPEIWSEAQWSPENAAFEGGLKLETGAMFEILEQIPNETLREFCKKYIKAKLPKEISVHAGLLGLTDKTMLAILTNAPGFFDTRDPEELAKDTPWNALWLDEQAHLETLGWNQCNWDLKSFADAKFPESMEKDWNELEPDEQIAILHLGFRDADKYHEAIKGARTCQRGWAEAIAKRGCKPTEREKGEDKTGEGKNEQGKTEGE
jgi:hypothetical protein